MLVIHPIHISTIKIQDPLIEPEYGSYDDADTSPCRQAVP